MAEITSPRTRVAMRILGVTPDDLLPGERRLPRNFQGSDQAKKEAIEILNGKRSEIMDALHAVRSRVTQTQVDQLVQIEQRSPSSARIRSHSAPQAANAEAAASPEVARLLRREQHRLDTLRKAMKDEIQGVLEAEMRKQAGDREKKEKEAKYQQRLAAMAGTRELEKQKREKEIAAKQEKKAALMNEKERKLRELKVILERKMREKMTQVEQKKQAILEIKHREAESFTLKLAQARNAIETKNQAKEQEAIGKFVALVQKWDQISNRKKEQQEENHKKAQAHTQAYLSRVAFGKQIAMKQTEAKIGVFLEENSRFQKARLLAKQRHTEQLTSMIEKNKKKAEQAKSLTERARQEAKEKLKEIRENFAAKNRDTTPAKQQLAAALVQRIRDHRSVHEVIVHENRRRVERARSFELEKRLAVLDGQLERNEIFKEQKRKLTEERNRTVVKSWIEKSHLLKQIDKLKNSANNDKMIGRLVKNLGISTDTLTKEATQ